MAQSHAAFLSSFSTSFRYLMLAITICFEVKPTYLDDSINRMSSVCYIHTRFLPKQGLKTQPCATSQIQNAHHHFLKFAKKVSIVLIFASGDPYRSFPSKSPALYCGRRLPFSCFFLGSQHNTYVTDRWPRNIHRNTTAVVIQKRHRFNLIM